MVYGVHFKYKADKYEAHAIQRKYDTQVNDGYLCYFPARLATISSATFCGTSA